jgi:hypothetical protein
MTGQKITVGMLSSLPDTKMVLIMYRFWSISYIKSIETGRRTIC